MPWIFFLGGVVKRPIKPLGKIYRTQKNRLPKSCPLSELQELEVRICVQPKFPIIILILLNGFHKFPRSRGLNSSVHCSDTCIVDKMLSEYVLAFKGVIMTVSFRNRVLIIDIEWEAPCLSMRRSWELFWSVTHGFWSKTQIVPRETHKKLRSP